MFRPGDIIGFCGRGAVSTMINIGTLGSVSRGWSHIAIINPTGWLYESTSLSETPCVVQNKVVKGVQVHEPLERIRSYQGRVFHYSLTLQLDQGEQKDLGAFLDRYLGVGYDTIGAARARSLGFGWLSHMLFRNGDLNSLFCSEYVAAALAHINRLSIRHAGNWNPNRLRRHLLRENIITFRGELSPST